MNKKRNRSARLLKHYLLDKQIYRVLERRGISHKTVQKAIDELDFEYPKLTPRACVIGIDTTYFGRRLGVVIFKDLNHHVVLHWVFVQSENLSTAIQGIEYLKQHGIIPLGYVVDGTWGFFVRYGATDRVQMCLKHMKNIVKRYVTTGPKLQAGKDLKQIVDKLPFIDEQDFNFEYNLWLAKYKDFLNERTYNEETHRWVYTHRRLKSAVRSLNRYRPYLFVYQHHQYIPATNNSVEGTNSGLKGFIKVHSGLRLDRKLKLIHFYLKEKATFEWGRQK